MANTSNLILPLIDAAQAQKHVTHNEALLGLDAIVHLSVLDRDLTAPPGSPADGDRYLVASGATGDWSGQDGNVVAWQDGVWRFYVPQPGWICWIVDEGIVQAFDGTSWGNVIGTALQNLAMLGVNTTADATNKLAVSSSAVLFNHAGADMQAKLNKNAAGDTASLLFQTNWSGRAEFGLLGNDDFRFKVSPGGSSWADAIVVDKDDAMVSLPEHSKFSATSNYDNYIAANAWTKINFNTMDHNDQGDFDAGNARFVAPADGYYVLGALFNFKENSTVPVFIAMKFYVGGAAIANTEQRYTGSIVTLETSLNTHAMLKLTSGDHVDVRVYFGTNDGYVEANTCAFWGAKVA